MKNTIVLLVLSLGITLGGYSQEQKKEKKWSAEIGIVNSWLIEQDVIKGFDEVDSGDLWDDNSLGFNIKGNYYLNKMVAIGIGHTNITFDGGSDSGANFTDIEAYANYASIELRGGEKFEGYGSFELGVSHIDDVDISIPDFGIGKLNMYKSSTNTYWSIGGGCKWHFDRNLFLNLGYRYRDFGELERNAANFTAALEDVRVMTSSIDLSIGFKF